MIYLLHEKHFSVAYSQNMDIVMESNIGDSFLVRADSCELDYIAEYTESDLEWLLNEEPFLYIEDEEIELEDV